ncbi:MAG: DUF2341 domain-containing protein [Fibrobacteria bacterium]|nr:DUF2341 domain-containing protein [Fibrobacteria bacterium]
MQEKNIFTFLLAGTGVVVTAVVISLMFSCSQRLTGGSADESGNPAIYGMVRYADGSIPLEDEGVSVTLYPAGYDPQRDGQVADSLKGSLDADGRFLLKNISEGLYNLGARDKDGVYKVLIKELSVTAESDTLRRDLELGRTGFIKCGIDGYGVRDKGYVYIPGSDVSVKISVADIAAGRVLIPNVPPGDYTMLLYRADEGSEARDLVSGDTLWVNSSDTSTLSGFHTWEHSVKVIINTSANGAATTEMLHGFPFLIRLDNSTFTFSQARDGGADVRFADGEGRGLHHQIQRWDTAARQAEIWVRVDTVMPDDSTQYIMMYWGNDMAENTSDGVLVFDTTAGFSGVWHMDGTVYDGTRLLRDATGNGYHGVMEGGLSSVDRTEGIIGQALAFDGIAKYVDLGTIASDFIAGVSVCGWVRYEEFNNWSRIFEAGNGRRNDNIVFGNANASDSLAMHIYNDTAHLTNSGPVLRKNEWEFVCASQDIDGATRYFLNGIPAGTKEGGQSLKQVLRDSCFLARSTWVEDGYFQGQLDEVRLHNRPLSADWVKLSWENQRPGSKFPKILFP